MENEKLYIIVMKFFNFKFKYDGDPTFSYFDRFAIPFLVQLIGKKIDNYEYRFNCLINIKEKTQNMQFAIKQDYYSTLRFDYDLSKPVARKHFCKERESTEQK